MDLSNNANDVADKILSMLEDAKNVSLMKKTINDIEEILLDGIPDNDKLYSIRGIIQIYRDLTEVELDD